jgi:hypothetical protein
MDRKLTDELFGSMKLNLAEEVAEEEASAAVVDMEVAAAAVVDMEAAVVVVDTAVAVGTTTEAAGKYIGNSNLCQYLQSFDWKSSYMTSSINLFRR